MTYSPRIFRNSLYIGVTTSIFGAQYAVAPQAAASLPPPPKTIECPKQEITRTVSGQLPKEWRASGAYGKLRFVHIRRRGHKQFLVCNYGRAGEIARDLPRGYACRPFGDTKTFICQSTSVLAYPTLRPGEESQGAPLSGPTKGSNASKGELALYDYDIANLDIGQVNAGHAGVRFYGFASRRPYLRPYGDMQLSTVSKDSRAGSRCKNAKFTTNSLSQIYLSDIRVGSYICYRTANGKVGEFKLAHKAWQNYYIKISYTNWN